MIHTFSKWDARRDVVIPGDNHTTVAFAVKHFVEIAKESISNHNAFYVALSGGSTPKAMFEQLSQEPYKSQVDWSKVHLFWSDERAVAADHPDSNYKMAMDAGFSHLGVPSSQIHRMVAEVDIEKNAASYEKTIRDTLKEVSFDLIMLGMGDDGHTASLFPQTAALDITDKLVAANFVPQKNTWRMTMTYTLINSAKHIAIYVLGANKKYMLQRVLSGPEDFKNLPIQKVGTKDHKSLWIVDEAAAILIKDSSKESSH